MSAFHDALGSGKQITLTCSGLAGQPDLIFVAQMYEQKPYGALQVRVRNTSGKEVTVQAIRTVAAQGGAIVALGGKPAADRVLSD
ncbi:melibiase, partial [Acinetobacter johnsonii]|nr:melibiase [Acinetobacter johnsonii]